MLGWPRRQQRQQQRRRTSCRLSLLRGAHAPKALSPFPYLKCCTEISSSSLRSEPASSNPLNDGGVDSPRRAPCLLAGRRLPGPLLRAARSERPGCGGCGGASQHGLLLLRRGGGVGGRGGRGAGAARRLHRQALVPVLVQVQLGALAHAHPVLLKLADGQLWQGVGGCGQRRLGGPRLAEQRAERLARSQRRFKGGGSARSGQPGLVLVRQRNLLLETTHAAAGGTLRAPAPARRPPRRGSPLQAAPAAQGAGPALTSARSGRPWSTQPLTRM